MTFLRSTFEPWTRRWTTPVKRIWRQADFFLSRNLMKVELFRWKCCSTSMKRMEWRRWISRTSVWVSYFSMSFVLSFKYWNQMSDCASSDDVIQNIFQNRKWWMSWRRQGGVKLLTSPKMSWPTRFSIFYTTFFFCVTWIIFKDIKKIFNLVDKDHSGEVSRSVSWTGFF